MARYELVEGTSAKFWEVDVSGNDMTVNFGRIGTAGQSKTKSFADAQAASKERDKLVKEKTGKGYSLAETAATTAATASSAVASAVAAAVAPTARAAKSAAVKVPGIGNASVPGPVNTAVVAAGAPSRQSATVPDSSSASGPVEGGDAGVQAAATAPAIDWPRGGFQWKDEWRKEMPVVRGIHAPPIEQGSPSLPKLIVLPKDQHGWRAQQFGALAATAGTSWTYWDEDLSRTRITEEAIAARDFDYWLELMAQAHVNVPYFVDWVVRRCVALHGLPFALKVVLALYELLPASSGWYYSVPGELSLMRHFLACADEAAYEEAVGAATMLRQSSDKARLACTSMFPDVSAWAVECIELNIADAQGLMRDCVLPAPVFVQYVKRHNPYLQSVRPALYLQIHLHGEAAFDALAVVLAQALGNKDTTLQALELVTRMHVPELVPLLVRELESREVRGALDKLATQYPAAVLKCAIEHSLASRNRTVEGWTIRLALREKAALASALAAIDDMGRARFEAMLAALRREDAPLEKLPALLREPPWLGKARQTELPGLEIAAIATVEKLEWSDTERELAMKCKVPQYLREAQTDNGFPEDLGLKPGGVARLLEGQPLVAGDVDPPRYNRAGAWHVLVAPEKARLALWNSYPAAQWSPWNLDEEAIRALLACYGVAALPGLLSVVQTFPDKGLPMIRQIDSPRLVDIALHALHNLKKTKDVAQTWIRAHPRTVLAKALPQAFHPNHSATRDNARFGVRWLMNNGFEALTREVAAEYGDAMSAALQALLSADPLLVLPGKMPKLPGFFVAASFRRPELPGGEALPLVAMEHIASMLAISKLEAPYAGLDIVKQTCTPTSLAEFAWDVFEAWIGAGAPSKEAWAFTALGLLGDDETARRLAPRIREWPGESAHARAVTGLDLLATIGSDVALMHLNGIAGKVKFKALQERAREKIATVAEARGFTPAELADRLVPDLGLDESGRLELNFGPRQFFVSFDEALKPFVKDAQGVRLKDLPKPIRSDDAALAEAASERYKQMKKDAKAIASLQITRLEMAMVARRRWPATDFKLFFIEHPLMRHLAARVIWGVYDNGSLTHNFRVAEDWTLADANDNSYNLEDGASVGISHIIEMPKASQEAFGQIFGDYEILQPFKQLGRETYSLTPEEQKLDTLTRFADKVVATGSVLGLVNRGWERGEAQDAGWVGEFIKQVGEDWQVDLQLDPGTVVGDMSYEPKQKLSTLTLRQRGSYDKSGLIPFSKCDPILASEVLRDIDLLAPMKD